jgi:hypothetical protein
VQHFHEARGCFGADTGPAARRLLADLPWSEDDYRKVHAQLARRRQVYEGETGFFPPSSSPSRPVASVR